LKHHSPTIAQETKTTVTNVVRWTQKLDRLHARIAPRFAQPEPLCWLLSSSATK